jgi:hypothetical protein
MFDHAWVSEAVQLFADEALACTTKNSGALPTRVMGYRYFLVS